MQRLQSLVLAICVGVLAAMSTSADAGERLTRDEVVETFIDTPWHSKWGAFLFRSDGTYSYFEFKLNKERGTWNYRLKPDGALSGASTDYIFLRRKNGSYYYFHTRSRRYFDAFPNRTYP